MTRARHILWLSGSPSRALLVGTIKVYRALLSSSLGGQCRFYPSCSHYAEDAIRTHGAAKGAALAIWRVARCGPFTKGGVDPVPGRRVAHAPYDSVLQTRPAS
jgi:putative membrane protein insertion efficiency factor